MSNFSKKGLREAKIYKDKVTRKHVKAVYAIMELFNQIIPKLDLEVEYNEENVNDYIKPLLGRELDHLEKFLLLGKIHYAKENLNEENVSEIK